MATCMDLLHEENHDDNFIDNCIVTNFTLIGMHGVLVIKVFLMFVNM